MASLSKQQTPLHRYHYIVRCIVWPSSTQHQKPYFNSSALCQNVNYDIYTKTPLDHPTHFFDIDTAVMKQRCQDNCYKHFFTQSDILYIGMIKSVA